MNHRPMTFDTFLEAPSNTLAAAACKAIAACTEEFYSPLWIFGPSGCGKTHLLNAVYDQLKNGTAINTVFLSVQEAMEAYVIRHRHNETTWNRIVTCDVLLLDDLDSLRSKFAVQAMLAFLILRKCEQKQRIILASADPPAEFPSLLKVLRWEEDRGLYVDIMPPDAALYKDIILRYEKEHILAITKNAVTYLAENAVSIPQLYGVLREALLWNQTNCRKVSLPWIRKHMDTMKR